MSGESAGQMAGIAVHLTYERPGDAVEWLCRVFGLRGPTLVDHLNGNGPSP